MAAPDVRDPDIVEKMLSYDRAKNEPEFELPAVIINLPENEHLMAIVAPNHE